MKVETLKNSNYVEDAEQPWELRQEMEDRSINRERLRQQEAKSGYGNL